MNIRIINETRYKRDSVSNLRRHYAVYRLYKSGLNLHIESELTGLNLLTIRNTIADIFTIECMASPACPFKEVLAKIRRK